jgi:hypothetical protein
MESLRVHRPLRPGFKGGALIYDSFMGQIRGPLKEKTAHMECTDTATHFNPALT